MFSSVAMPASITIRGLVFGERQEMISSSVPGSLILPGKTSVLFGNPSASTASARVTKGQSPLFSLELPKCALLLYLPEPSKKVLVRS